jgi:hypothetical protein
MPFFKHISHISRLSVLLVEETRVPGVTADMPQMIDKVYHIRLYQVHLAISQRKLTILMVIVTDWLHRNMLFQLEYNQAYHSPQKKFWKLYKNVHFIHKCWYLSYMYRFMIWRKYYGKWKRRVWKLLIEWMTIL